jgi:threonine/homoserine/homoserine lactone efflux protein
MMNLDVLLALTLFAVVSTVTPGPNNLMLMSSGANFGFRRSMPHMTGVILGFAFMIVLVGMGLMTVFETWPISHIILKTLSVIYLIYLAYKIAFSSSPTKNCDEGAKPLTFLQACAFQWVNPKAWSMALTAISVYSPDRTLFSIILIASIFAVANVPAGSLWTVLGQKISIILDVPRRLKIFNFTMAGCLLASIYPVVV